ncbi:hypothetical protein Mnod_3509 [Methylobacterium nodulans ORS 2060]|uniref:Uncharacterized protein n=1 Tax=Methylobacterium nodulans (strain LMG 21967 / CNCM I-2342 / ORS 2060) TaxID=460265 RepID=B8INQ3_METNO|nr:hypothetical protein Mnod_3509 [Methylobacterium nodulans ORS 2060]
MHLGGASRNHRLRDLRPHVAARRRELFGGPDTPTIGEVYKLKHVTDEQLDAVFRDYRQFLSSLNPCGPLKPVK